MKHAIFGGEMRRCVSALVCLLLGPLWGCHARNLSPPPLDPVPMERSGYVVGVQDVLQISVWKNEELSVRVPVRSDGKISVPLVDDVQAEGLQAMEIKEVLTRELSEFITAPDVTVVVLEMNSKYVNVIGAVPRSGQIPLVNDLRVLEAIATMGGFALFADTGDIRIVRRQPDGSEVEFRFDYDAYIKGRAPGTNIVLQSGDTIIVPE
ncbi:MAG: polysaccharide biosynthesis/export family protein [Deltaproteobacteria bacterium]|jgi:polysaccharide export outer membrane protein|nr:polysaccharide biosynthesis/export family protein [Deltaproteobacteria bacterium]